MLLRRFVKQHNTKVLWKSAVPKRLSTPMATLNNCSGVQNNRFFSSSSSSSTTTQNEPRASTSHEQMETDKRYQATMDTPESLLQQDYTSDFSIKDGFLPGVASYLDNQATTPMDPRVLDAMMPMYMQRFGNPHSRTRK